jgi:predicted RNA-binding protein (virulence factor B family)
MDKELLEKVEDGVFEKGQQVDGEVKFFSPLGANVAINSTYLGLLYQNEIFQDLQIGDKVKVYIKNIRPDKKVELTLQPQGYKKVIGGSTERILSELKAAGGSLPFNDKSDPQAIYEKFQMSKKNFKQAIGALYKQKKITIQPTGIKIV